MGLSSYHLGKIYCAIPQRCLSYTYCFTQDNDPKECITIALSHSSRVARSQANWEPVAWAQRVHLMRSLIQDKAGTHLGHFEQQSQWRCAKDTFTVTLAVIACDGRCNRLLNRTWLSIFCDFYFAFSSSFIFSLSFLFIDRMVESVMQAHTLNKVEYLWCYAALSDPMYHLHIHREIRLIIGGKVSVLRPYVGMWMFIGTSVAAGIYARRFKFVHPYPYYARITPVFVLRPYVLSIDQGAKHRGIFDTKVCRYV